VPAGRTYQEWHEPRVLTRIVYFYFDPASLPVPVEACRRVGAFGPRGCCSRTLRLSDTALKLRRLIETTGADSSPYFEDPRHRPGA